MNLFGRSEKYEIPSVSERFLRARIYHEPHKSLIIKTIFARKNYNFTRILRARIY
jgi:hypothetical protein